MADILLDAVAPLGVPAESLVDFSAPPSPRHLRYMDLMPKVSTQESGELLPQGVVEAGGRPTVYLLQPSVLSAGELDSAQLADLIRTLACRADARYLAVLRPGSTQVFKLGFYAANAVPREFQTIDIGASASVRNLLNGLLRADGEGQAPQDWLDNLLFRLLSTAAETIRNACDRRALSDEAVLSLIGRALFTRFLVDRGIARATDLHNISPHAKRPEDLFHTVEATARTFNWLDHTFNGNLLEVGTDDYVGLLNGLGHASQVVCNVLSDIMRRAPGGQLELDWDGLRFKHIPVDVLSQVYEHFAHLYSPQTAHRTSIHYTPRAIAELVVDGAFSATPPENRASARVLDAAVGAGVFLVLAFRRLVAEYWLATGVRPRRKKIRRILLDQLCGLDINEQSIKVAALSLYLAALELDPDPQPLSDLKFDRLFDRTLRCVDASHLSGRPDADLGSLSKALLELPKFEMVLGNPPWTKLAARFKPLLDETAIGITSLNTGGSGLVPKQWPDLAFIWRSIQWCKPGGVIGLLVHARLLFGQETFAARATMFQRVRVTGVLNGAALRKEKRIWPSNTQAFCAFVAVNETPEPEDSFYFLSPRYESTLGRQGQFRLDPKAAVTIPSTLPVIDSTVFKVLSRGSSLDLELISRLRRVAPTSVGEYLNDLLLSLNQGFIRGDEELDESNRRRTAIFHHSPWMAGYPVVEGLDEPEFFFSSEGRTTVEKRYPAMRFQWPRSPEIYKGPLLLFRQAPKFSRAQRGAILTDGDVAFGRAFHGVATGRDKESEAVGDYLYVLSYCDLLMYWALLTSSQFAVEREVFNQADFTTFPVVPFDQLSDELRVSARSIARQIKAGTQPWDKVESFVAKVYKLNGYDRLLVNDALKFESPYTEAQTAAQTPVTQEELRRFCIYLEHCLGQSGVELARVQPCADIPGTDGWRFVNIAMRGRSELPDSDLVQTMLRTAQEPFMASELQMQARDGSVIIGRISHARHWSESQARLLALSLVENGLLELQA